MIACWEYKCSSLTPMLPLLVNTSIVPLSSTFHPQVVSKDRLNLRISYMTEV